MCLLYINFTKLMVSLYKNIMTGPVDVISELKHLISSSAIVSARPGKEPRGVSEVVSAPAWNSYRMRIYTQLGKVWRV